MKLSIKGMAVACGILWGGAVCMVALINLARPDYGIEFLKLLNSIYPGYEGAGNLKSALIVTGYGLVDGALGGILFALLYNLCSGKCGSKT